MAGIAQTRARRQEAEKRRGSGSDKQQNTLVRETRHSHDHSGHHYLCVVTIVVDYLRGEDALKSQNAPPLPLLHWIWSCPGLRQTRRSRKLSGCFPSCLWRMYISGEGPNLLLHIALIKQWKASGQTDGRAKKLGLRRNRNRNGTFCSGVSGCISFGTRHAGTKSRRTSVYITTRCDENQCPLSLKLVQPPKGGHFVPRWCMWDLCAWWSDLKRSDKILLNSKLLHSIGTFAPEGIWFKWTLSNAKRDDAGLVQQWWCSFKGFSIRNSRLSLLCVN